MGEQVELEDWIAENMARRRAVKKDCVACDNTRKNSRGGDCVCVTARKKRGKKKVITRPVPNPTVTKRRRPKQSFSVTFVEREARAMFTAAPSDQVDLKRVEGAIVRIRPGEDDTAEDVDGFRDALVSMGAAQVKSMGATPQAPALKPIGDDGSFPALTDTTTPRDAVKAILDEENDEALTDACEASMSAVGL